MWELDCEESWVPKNWCFWNVVLEKALESPLDCKEIQPVHPKGDQSWVFVGRTDAEAETPILWPPHVKSWLTGKDPDAGRDCGQEEKGTTEDEMAGWHHRLDGHEFEWTPGVGDRQGGLAYCDSWGCKESHTTEVTELNWTELWPSGNESKTEGVIFIRSRSLSVDDQQFSCGNQGLLRRDAFLHQFHLSSFSLWALSPHEVLNISLMQRNVNQSPSPLVNYCPV